MVTRRLRAVDARRLADLRASGPTGGPLEENGVAWRATPSAVRYAAAFLSVETEAIVFKICEAIW
jgi:hypothetical protein